MVDFLKIKKEVANSTFHNCYFTILSEINIRTKNENGTDTHV